MKVGAPRGTDAVVAWRWDRNRHRDRGTDLRRAGEARRHART
ncbi:hypothetical protein CZ774_07380 [Frigoribacterium sp. JB110]|nr:hypothetical protein CZ774_07380 [Frigoribacterium sp. JB110]